MKIARHLRRNLIAYAALFVALGGTSYAAASKLLPKNSVASPQIVNGSVQRVDMSKRTISALKGLRGAQGPQGAQGSQGAQGAQGAQGPKGDTGAPATRLWAVVDGTTGALIRGSGILGTSKPYATGGYRITFNQPVASCAWLATIESASASNGEISVRAFVPNQSAIEVFTFNGSGASADQQFHVAALC